MVNNEPKTVAVGNNTYIIQKFDAEAGIRIFIRIAKIIAEPVARSVDLKNMDEASEKFGEVLGDIAGILVSKVDEDEAIRTINDLMDAAIVEGTGSQSLKGRWKQHFRGQLAQLMQVLNEVVSENYDDFLLVLKSVVAKAHALRTQKPKSPGPTT